MTGKRIPNGDVTLANAATDTGAPGGELGDCHPKPRRLKSLAELGEIADWLEASVESQDVDSNDDSIELSTDDSIESLAGTLAAIERDLASVGSRDAAARRSAEATLEEHARLTRRCDVAKMALDRAEGLVRKAERLATDAFTDEARAGATALRERLREAVRVASAERDRAASAVIALAREPGLIRILAERARLEEETRAAATRAEREARRRDSLARAKTLLGEIRRRLRGDPKAVITAVESLDLRALDDDLARQLFGAWLRAGRELGIDGLLRYAPLPHRGALLAPADDGALRVVSAVGGITLRPGEVLARGRFAGLRPVADAR